MRFIDITTGSCFKSRCCGKVLRRLEDAAHSEGLTRSLWRSHYSHSTSRLTRYATAGAGDLTDNRISANQALCITERMTTASNLIPYKGCEDDRAGGRFLRRFPQTSEHDALETSGNRKLAVVSRGEKVIWKGEE